MADRVDTGFGTTLPVTLSVGSPNDVLARFLQSQPDSIVRLRSIIPVSLQISGAFNATNYIPLWVIRFASTGNPTGQISVPVHPSSAGAVGLSGLPQIQDIPSAVEVVLAMYIRVQNQGVPIDVDIQARYGQVLGVCVGPLVDGSVSPPGAQIQSNLGLSIFGETIFPNQDAHALSVATGKARSLPRYDL